MPLDLPHLVDAHFSQQPPAIVQTWQPAPAPFGGWCQLSSKGSWGELMKTQHHIDQLASMSADWDGYGAVPISQETKLNALRALEVVARSAPVPDVVPNSNGTLSFEWETAAGFGHLEIGQTRFSFYLKPNAVGSKSILADGQAADIPMDIGAYVSAVLFPERLAANAVTRIAFSGWHV